MRLPTPLSRHNLHGYKNQFGHILIISGSRNMIGAAALCGLAAMRSGSGLVTLGIPQSLNKVIHEKISPVIMTLPLSDTKQQTIALKAFEEVKNEWHRYSAIAIGPGLSQNKSTQKFIYKMLETAQHPMVIDADALNAIALNLKILKKTKFVKILTPHPGEMARLMGFTKKVIQEKDRKKIARDFAEEKNCIIVLKGHNSLVANPDGKVYINKTGNPGMATAGSGDVLTGMISAFLGQGLSGFDAAKYAVYLHGKAGDISAKMNTRLSMIATDIIDNIPKAIKMLQEK